MSQTDTKSLVAQNLDERIIEIEKNMIMEALFRSGGIQVKAAKILGIKERSLWHKIKKYQIDTKPFKQIMD